MTLVEVMLSAAILAILAIMATTALFYPRLLVVNSGLEQSAIHAGIGEIERNLYATNSTLLVQFTTDGWDPITITTIPNIITNSIPGTVGDTAEYLEIETTIEYRDGKAPVELITYRSLEITPSSR